MMDLSSVIKLSIKTKEPYKGLTGAGFFDGSFDWHSCVHAHWALAAMGEKIDLPLEKIEAELLFLKNNKDFENPYGRAWLLLLLEQVGFPNTLLQEMTDWLWANDFPEKKDLNFLGTHRSWLFTYFLTKLAHPESIELQKIKDEKFAPMKARIFTFDQQGDLDPWDFIDFTALLSTIELLDNNELSQCTLDRLEIKTKNFIAMEFKDLQHKDAHRPGRYAMLLWPYALLGHENYDKIHKKFSETPQIWKENFAYFSHWIPQFLYMGHHLKVKGTKSLLA